MMIMSNWRLIIVLIIAGVLAVVFQEKEMSKTEIRISDDGWIPGYSGIRPQDKQLCIVILAGGSVRSAQYKKKLYEINDVFLSLNIPTYYSWSMVDRWKPLNLPTDVNERILAEIDEWFEEDDY